MTESDAAIDADAALRGEPFASEAPTLVGAPASAPHRASRRRWPALAALAALALAAGAAIAIALGAGHGGGHRTASGTTTRQDAGRPATPAKTERATASQPAAPPTTSTPVPPPSQAGTDDPVALNDRGFSLLQQGSAAQAVAPLQRSVQAFRAQGRKAQIDYAYALYNLGNALRLSGHPDAAIPYLEERLSISNFKRGVVEHELQAAREQSTRSGA